jgi:hypothetical protein
MATAPVGPQETKPRRQMREVKAPEQFQFTKPNQYLEGVLISIEPVTVKEKSAIEYMFVQENGERITCLGTNDLNKKIHPGHIGYMMHIRYERDDTSFQKAGQNAMKIFKVLVSEQKESGF